MYTYMYMYTEKKKFLFAAALPLTGGWTMSLGLAKFSIMQIIYSI